LQFIDNPTPDSWTLASVILVRPLTTLWQAVRMVDKTFPKEGRQILGGKVIKEWARIPDAMTVTRAIRYVVEKAKKEPPKKKRPDLFDFEEEVETMNQGQLLELVQGQLEEELDILVDP